MKIIFLAFIIFFLSSCKQLIVNDPMPISSVDANYYNGELIINGKKTAGLGTLLVKATDDPKNDKIQVYGAYEGELTIFSRQCGINKRITYKQGQYTEISMDTFFEEYENCFLTIHIAPTFMGGDETIYAQSTYKVGMYIRVLPDNVDHILNTNFEDYIQLRKQTEATPDHGPSIYIESKPNNDVLVTHCNPEYNDNPAYDPIKSPEIYKQFKADDKGNVIVDVDKLYIKNSLGCRVGFKDKDANGSRGYMAFLVSIYDPNFLPLPEIRIETYEKQGVFKKFPKLRVVGSKLVTMTDINGEMFYSYAVDIDYDSNKEYIIRQYTIKGRTIYCTFKNGAKECY